jgi:hypothetical protein
MHHNVIIDSLFKTNKVTYPKLLQRDDFPDQFPEILHLSITSAVERGEMDFYLTNPRDEIF